MWGWVARMRLALRLGLLAGAAVVALAAGGMASALGPVTVTPSVFSPDGDGVSDTATITAAVYEAPVAWSVYVRDAGNVLVRQWDGVSASVSVVWDGRDQVGAPVPEGAYSVEVRAELPWGPESSFASVTVDVPPALSGVSVPPAFSPNGDGVQDTLPLAGDAFSSDGDVTGMGADVYALRSGNGYAYWVNVASFLGTPVNGGHWTLMASWDGVDAYTGQRLPDGQYQVVFWATDADGNVATATRWVRVDTAGPVAGTFSAPAFSPNGDGYNDTTTVSGALQDRGAVASWTVEVWSSAGQAVRHGSGSGGQVSWVWDGKDDLGADVPDGNYQIVVSATDDAGNTSRYAVASTKVRRSPPGIAFALATGAFAPAAGPARFNFRADVAVSGAWEVEGPGGVLASGVLPNPSPYASPYTVVFNWSGRDAQGADLPTGTYVLRFRVRDAVYGPVPTEVSVPVLLDRDAPALSGFGVSQVSPGRYHFTGAAADAGDGRVTWRVEVLNSSGQVVYWAQGYGGAVDAWYNRNSPAYSRWRYYRRLGGYAAGVSYRVTLTDGLGNTSVTTGTLP